MAAAAHATKILEAQRARQIANGSYRSSDSDSEKKVNIASAKSQKAYQQIRKLTEHYNKNMAGGKWNHSMNMKPRDLPVYDAPTLPTQLTDKEMEAWLKQAPAKKAYPINLDGAMVRNACKYQHATEGSETVQMLGHSMNAVALPKNGELTYNFNTDTEGQYLLHVALIPTQPNDGGDLRFSVSVDGDEPTVFTLKEKFRSEGWKQNVLRGQAVRQMPLKLNRGSHTLKIKAIDNHIIVDQWMIDSNPKRKFYLFPN